VIHVGANYGQEFERYRIAGVERALYIEPIPTIFRELQAKLAVDPAHQAVMALCSDTDGQEVEFNVANNDGQSSSMYALGTHSEAHPEIAYTTVIRMQTTTLDRILFETDIDPSPFDCLVMDVQGAEAKVIAGATRTLAQCKVVFTEINDAELYKGGASMEQVFDLLRAQGFILKSMDTNAHGYGNALLIKRP